MRGRAQGMLRQGLSLVSESAEFGLPRTSMGHSGADCDGVVATHSRFLAREVPAKQRRQAYAALNEAAVCDVI